MARIQPTVVMPGQRTRCQTTPNASSPPCSGSHAANQPLRVRLLGCLMQPLGTLGIAGVAAGAFAVFVGRDGSSITRIDIEAVAQVAQVTSRQVHELALFVEQVDPQALLQFASLASGSSLALASGFSAAALALLYRRLQPTLTARAATAARLRRPA